MATFTLAQMLASGIQSAAIDEPGLPGYFVAEWELDGAKKAIAAADFAEFLEIPPYAGVLIQGAGIEILRPGTASGTIDLGIAGTDITGLTGWAADAAAGTKLVKLATAANSVIATGSAVRLTAQQNTAGLGTGRYRVRIFGTFFAM